MDTTQEEKEKIYLFLTEELWLGSYLNWIKNLYEYKSIVLWRMWINRPLSMTITAIKLWDQYTVDEFISRVTGIEHKDQLNYLQLLAS